MTTNQKYIMTKVKERINDLRFLLDEIMYRTGDLPDDEYKKLRSAYDDICSINDRLF